MQKIRAVAIYGDTKSSPVPQRIIAIVELALDVWWNNVVLMLLLSANYMFLGFTHTRAHTDSNFLASHTDSSCSKLLNIILCICRGLQELGLYL